MPGIETSLGWPNVKQIPCPFTLWSSSQPCASATSNVIIPKGCLLMSTIKDVWAPQLKKQPLATMCVYTKGYHRGTQQPEDVHTLLLKKFQMRQGQTPSLQPWIGTTTKWVILCHNCSGQWKDGKSSLKKIKCQRYGHSCEKDTLMCSSSAGAHLHGWREKREKREKKEGEREGERGDKGKVRNRSCLQRQRVDKRM